jgi:hypothetical protein
MKPRILLPLATAIFAMTLAGNAQEPKKDPPKDEPKPAAEAPKPAAEAPKPEEPAKPAESAKAGDLSDPASFTEKAPEKFKVEMETTKGKFIIECERS